MYRYFASLRRTRVWVGFPIAGAGARPPSQPTQSVHNEQNTISNCTGTACMEINKNLACTLPKSKNRVAAKCTSVASALVATRFCTSVMLYKRWVFISSTRSRAVMSVTPLCRWTCALVQVIERRALAYIRVASKEFILSILGCVCFNYLCSEMLPLVCWAWKSIFS